MSSIIQNKSYWENMDDVSLNNYAEEIFNHYRLIGFPYYSLSFEEKLKDYRKTEKYLLEKNLIEDKSVKQTMHLLGVAWNYFPHAFDVKCGNKRTPIEVFNDDELFMKAIKKRLKHGTYISDSGIRKILRIYSNTQSVSNFRPTAATAIYDHFLTDNESIVLDMSGGWGGRMLGASLSPKVGKYIYCEPSTKTYSGLGCLSSFLSFVNPNFKTMGYELGSEDLILEDSSLDLCFTSPPYFDLEKYSTEDTQSFIKYPTIKKWSEGFLRKTIENCFSALKNNKYMVINIADPSRGGYSIVDETIKFAKESGFEYIDEYKLVLSNLNKSNFKYEPILIFKKR